MEEYRDIISFEGLYQISNLGNIKSLKRKGCLNDRVLKPKPNSKGYMHVTLHKNKKQQVKRVHKLMEQMYFKPLSKESELVIDHINNDKSDNSIDNLQRITVRHNNSKDRTGYTSKYIGVSWNKERNKWASQLGVNGINLKLGYFIDEHDAHLAYQSALNTI